MKLVFSPPTFCLANYSYLAFLYSQVCPFISQRSPGCVWIPASTASWKFSLYSHRGKVQLMTFFFLLSLLSWNAYFPIFEYYFLFFLRWDDKSSLLLHLDWKQKLRVPLTILHDNLRGTNKVLLLHTGQLSQGKAPQCLRCMKSHLLLS